MAISIDSLVIEFSLALLQVRIWFPCIIIGIRTAGFYFPISSGRIYSCFVEMISLYNQG
ncbi:MAG TPA: hypothetical protein ENH29_05130 [Bacteroidetes bacterium]|nr:hypothetical protein [Bacteroidota bacterium]